MNVYEKCAGLNFDVELDDDEMVSDAVILARVTRMSDGRSSFVLCGNEGLDVVTRTGLIECGRQVNDGGWHDVDEEDDL